MPVSRNKVLPRNVLIPPAARTPFQNSTIPKRGEHEHKQQRRPELLRSTPSSGCAAHSGDSESLVVKRCPDIEERARILNHDENDQEVDACSTKPLQRKVFCLSMWLNFLVLLLAGPLLLTIFCNDACEYNSPNIVCAAVNKSDPAQSYVCLNNADECQCADASLKGDNKCDPFNNNCGCGWDGGDCCSHDFDTTFCNLDPSLCKCLDPWASKLCTLGTCNPATTGDGQCDGHNNNCNCDWDGGDCCVQPYNCSKNCRIVGANTYNLNITSFSTCDYIGTVHLRGTTYCEELESSFGCDCAGCACDLNSVGGTGCSGSGCHCKDPTSPAFFAHNDAEKFTTYIPENYVASERPSNATQMWALEDVCEYIDFEVYEWDDACTCPCRVSVRWYVDVGWIVVFGVVYFVYLMEAVLMHTLLVKSACRHSFVGERLMAKFSSETLRFVRRVDGSARPSVAVQQFRDAPPVFIMRMATFQSKQRFAAGLKPLRTAAARMRMTFWRDETVNVLGLDSKCHAKMWFKKTLCFDGYSTSTFFDKRRRAFIETHASTSGEFQCYSEDFVVPDFRDFGIWSKPRNILIGSLPYLICTFAGLSWFYRMFVELATTSLRIEVIKMVSVNDHAEKLRDKGNKWRVVRVA